MKQRQHGFTLMELLVVLVLVVAAVGFGGIQMMGTYRHNQLDHAVHDMTTLLRYLQLTAIQEERVYELSVADDQKQLVIQREADDGESFKPVRPLLMRTMKIGNTLSVKLERGDRLFFYPDGTSSKNRIIIHRQSDYGRGIMLKLKNRIGSVEVIHG